MSAMKIFFQTEKIVTEILAAISGFKPVQKSLSIKGVSLGGAKSKTSAYPKKTIWMQYFARDCSYSRNRRV